MPTKIKQLKPKYHLNKQGEFVIENYSLAKPFASFFPGIAGKYGIPMWVFYVNRGQCISSFGTKDKDRAILEFFPANKSWQLVCNQGFRTFLKIKHGRDYAYYEPFHNADACKKYETVNSMRIGASQLTLEEDNRTLGIKICVEYFNIPNDSYAGLSRTVTIENTGKQPKSLQLIDGLPQVVPFGMHNFFLKKLSRTIEAWMTIDNLENKAPFYRLEVDPSDRPEVVHIDAGNFYLGFHSKGEKTELLSPIVDPEAVFGPVTDFSIPAQFLNNANFTYPARQMSRNKTPSALLLVNYTLKPGEQKTFYAVIGQARNVKILNRSIAKITKFGYIEKKRGEDKQLIEKLKSEIATQSSCPELDFYSGQTYLDNIMRGGYPEVLRNGTVFYLYSRKHGDLERDYNKFQLQPTYFSQGNGNYRDMNQNRRNDVWFNPEIKDENIISFMNLIQTDGFNPLVIKGESFFLKENVQLPVILEGVTDADGLLRLGQFFKKSFTPGDLIFFVEENKINLKLAYDDFLSLILGECGKVQEAEHAEGYWTDHWAYNLDLIERYLDLYPEKFHELFFEKKVFSYFDNAELVRPRSEKYVLYNGKPRQLHALILDPAKKEMLHKRALHPFLSRSACGNGDIYYTTLTAKLLCLAVNKLATLDPFGIGIEMEANKPNWFDSLNGLPALFGSSTCETFELKRLVMLIKSALERYPENNVELAEEVAKFIQELSALFAQEPFAYWDNSNILKEEYRHTTRMGFSGNTVCLSARDLILFLDAALNKLEAGLKKAFDENQGTYASYFFHEVAEYDLVKEHHIRPKRFIQRKVPLFLEGQMHALRLAPSTKEALLLYKATRKSALFDKELKMYKVTSALAPMPEEIGRCRIFTPGWLENESIWLHMEYKYLLEMLKNGLVKEFYAEFKNILIPFQNPQRYGRSILENSSFLVSSVFPDKKLHGNGFVARLSGSTAEYLQIWLTINSGNKPFSLGVDGKLNLTFNPSLPGWLFTRNGKYSFKFLGSISVTYYNHKRKSTFGKNAAKISKILLFENEQPIEINSSVLTSSRAEKVRLRQIKKIDIYLE